jgi:proline iminopeptidase
MRNILTLMAFLLLTACDLEDWSKPGNLVPQTADQDGSIPSLQINGTVLHVETYGDPADPIVIVIHGGPGGDFRSLLNAKDLADEGYFVVFYDQHGTGLSQRVSRSVFESEDAVQRYIEDLDEIIHHFRTGAQKVFLFGHSWGAMLATGYIDQHPDVISGAILAEPGGLTWSQAKSYVDRTREIEMFDEALNDALMPEQIIAGRSEDEILDYKATFFLAMESAPGNITGNAGPTPYWRHGSVAFDASTEFAEKHGFDFTQNLSQFSPKVLVMYSELNRAYGRSWAEQVVAPFPNAEITEISNTGHDILYFGWADCFPKALNYLNEIR